MKPKKAKPVFFEKDYYQEDTSDDIYDKDFWSDGVDSDLMSAEEQGFMQGYLGDCYV